MAKQIGIYKLCIKTIILGVFVCAMFWRCANSMAPQGGPRDTIPPKVVLMNPKQGATNFNSKRIFIEFDEYIQLKDQQKNIYTSPFMEKKPVINLRGKGIQIDLKEDLDSNTTYSINFGNSIIDNNENNPYVGLRYVFSTGNKLDSLVMSGQTVNGFTKDTVGNVFILFYKANLDSIPDYDSTVYKSSPTAVGRSFPNGIFITENLKPIDYKIYALEDNNNNMKYEPGVDRIAFLDTIYNPAKLQDFSMWYDTTRNYMQADPQVYFKLFKEKQVRRQNLTGSTRPLSNKLYFTFSAPNPKIEKFTLEGIDSSRIITEYTTAGKDSIVYWLNVPKEQLKDTIRGEIVYQKHDSLGVLQPFTQQLKLGWKAAPLKQKNKRDEKKDSVDRPTPMKVTTDAQALINPEKDIKFTFDFPIDHINENKVSLLQISEKDTSAVGFKFVRDSVKIRQWALNSKWTPDTKYILEILPEAFNNINGETNDTLKANFATFNPEKFATLELNLKGGKQESEYIIQITTETGQVKREIPHLKQGKHILKYVDPGVIRIRIIEDANHNGQYDEGNLTKRHQSENVEYFITPNGELDVTTKANWDLVYDIDLDQVFAPITMEVMQQRIARMEAARAIKRAAERAEEAKKPKQKTQNNSRNSGGFGNGSGGGMPQIPGLRK